MLIEKCEMQSKLSTSEKWFLKCKQNANWAWDIWWPKAADDNTIQFFELPAGTRYWANLIASITESIGFQLCHRLISHWYRLGLGFLQKFGSPRLPGLMQTKIISWGYLKMQTKNCLSLCCHLVKQIANVRY